MLSCSDHQDRFTQRRTELARPGDGEPPAVGEVTWRLSAEQAERLYPGTVFTTSAVGEYLTSCGAAAGPQGAWDALLSLERTGLAAIDPASAPLIVWIYPVVAAQVRAAMPEEMLDRAVRAAAEALVEMWPANEPQPWSAADLRSCVTSLQQAAAERLWAADACPPVLLRAGNSMDAADRSRGELLVPTHRHQ
jgi:hypothetical protein